MDGVQTGEADDDGVDEDLPEEVKRRVQFLRNLQVGEGRS